MCRLRCHARLVRRCRGQPEGADELDDNTACSRARCLLCEDASREERGVDGRTVLGHDHVGRRASEALESVAEDGSRTTTRDRASGAVEHDDATGALSDARLTEVVERDDQPLHRDRVAARDDHHDVSGRERCEGRSVALGRSGVVDERLVLLERRRAVHDDDVRNLPCGRPDARQGRRRNLAPSRGPSDPREDPETRQDDGGERRESVRREPALGRGSGGQHQPGRLVEQSEVLRDGRGVRVRIDQQHPRDGDLPSTAGADRRRPRELGREVDGERRPPWCSRRAPDGDEHAVPRRRRLLRGGRGGSGLANARPVRSLALPAASGGDAARSVRLRREDESGERLGVERRADDSVDAERAGGVLLVRRGTVEHGEDDEAVGVQPRDDLEVEAVLRRPVHAHERDVTAPGLGDGEQLCEIAAAPDEPHRAATRRERLRDRGLARTEDSPDHLARLTRSHRAAPGTATGVTWPGPARAASTVGRSPAGTRTCTTAPAETEREEPPRSTSATSTRAKRARSR